MDRSARTALDKILRAGVMFSGLAVGLVWILAFPAAAQIDVWIDPGHGGGDPGAVGYNGPALPNEKELNIAVAGYLQNELLALGYESCRTQNSDATYFDKITRAQIANGESENDEGFRAPGLIFISIHMNSYKTSSALGTETYFSAVKYDAKGKDAARADVELAGLIQQELMTYADAAFFMCSDDRGIKIGNNLVVLKYTRVPAALVECCFISNGCQWSHMITAGDQDLVARGIAIGVGKTSSWALSGRPCRIP